MPACTKFMAMPPPIVPAPIMPTFLMSRSFVSAGTSSILAAWRSAKNRWRMAADWVPNISFMNCSRSNWSPSAIVLSVALTTHAMLAAGASKPLNLRALALVNSATASGSGLAVISSMRGIGWPATS